MYKINLRTKAMIKYEMFYKSTLLCKAIQDQRFCAIIIAYGMMSYLGMTPKKMAATLK